MPMPNNSRFHRLFLELLQKLRDVASVCGAHIDRHFPRQRFFTLSAAVFVLDGVDLALVVGDPLGIVHKLGAVHSEHARWNARSRRLFPREENEIPDVLVRTRVIERNRVSVRFFYLDIETDATDVTEVFGLLRTRFSIAES